MDLYTLIVISLLDHPDPRTRRAITPTIVASREVQVWGMDMGSHHVKQVCAAAERRWIRQRMREMGLPRDGEYPPLWFHPRYYGDRFYDVYDNTEVWVADSLRAGRPNLDAEVREMWRRWDAWIAYWDARSKALAGEQGR